MEPLPVATAFPLAPVPEDEMARVARLEAELADAKASLAVRKLADAKASLAAKQEPNLSAGVAPQPQVMGGGPVDDASLIDAACAA